MVMGLISACATYQPVPAFAPMQIRTAGYELKANNVVFILDASSSMADGCQDWRKFDLGKALTTNMIATLPDGMSANAGLRTFGHALGISRDVSLKAADVSAFQRDTLTKGLAKIKEPGGPSYLDKAIAEAGKDLKGLSGKSALIIVSDGMATGSGATAAAKALKAQMGDALCIYTVLVGDDAGGWKQMQAIANESQCGVAVRGSDLFDGRKMADFLSTVFVGDALDSDGDGVPDIIDECPGTPRGVKVDAKGCPITILSGKDDNWIFETITFEINKAILRPSSFSVLDEVADALIVHHPDMKLEVQGHTDTTGPRAFNMRLSKDRANAARDYLIKKGVSPDRLTWAGYGPDKPIADNKTEAGRIQNRRVQFSVRK